MAAVGIKLHFTYVKAGRFTDMKGTGRWQQILRVFYLSSTSFVGTHHYPPFQSRVLN